MIYCTRELELGLEAGVWWHDGENAFYCGCHPVHNGAIFELESKGVLRRVFFASGKLAGFQTLRWPSRP